MNPAPSAADGVGPPVNPVVGAHVLADVEDLDFELEGPLPLEWQRSYRSTNLRAGWFGKGWSSPFEVSLEMVADTKGEFIDHIECIDVFGRRLEFPYLSPGSTFFLASEKLTLSRSPLSQYELQTAGGLTYQFDDSAGAVHRLAALIDRNGNATRLDYREAEGGLAAVLVACSGKQRLELIFHASRLREVIERRESAAGAQRITLMRYAYTPEGDLAQVINRANERMRTFEYNDDRLIRYQTYAGTFESWCEYSGRDAESRVILHRDNVGQSWALDYHADHTAVTDQDGRIWRYHVDAQRRWTGTTDPLGQFTRYGLDRNGNLRAVIDPAGHVTETFFDERSNPVEIRDPMGATTKIEWHPVFALPIAITDALNRTCSYAYDERGNLVLEVDPDGAETRYLLDERGLQMSIVDAKGGTVVLERNDAGQVTSYTDCSKRTTLVEYDADGNLVAVIDALGQRTTYTYDAVGRMRSETLPDGSREEYESDLADRLLSITNALGAKTQFRYAADGLLVEQIDALGHSRHHRYDNARRLVEVVNENGASYRFAHDVLDRLVDEMAFDGVRRRYGYDNAGQLVFTIDAPESTQAIVTRYRRDAMDRVLEIETGSEKSTFSYDAAGQLEEARNAHVQLRFAYDAVGRLIEEAVTALEQTYSLQHAYDPLGNRLSTILPDGSELGTLYYGSEHAHQIHLNGEPITDLERNELHEEVARTQGRLATTQQYDPVGRLQQRFTRPAAQPTAPLAVVKSAEIDRRYTYDKAGRLIVAQDRGRQFAYGYDALDRLTHFNGERFGFDPAHNMTLADSLAPAVAAPDNRLPACGNARYRYDTHGRLVEKQAADGSLIQLKWNEQHLLVESSIQNLHESRTTEYLYDPLGRRVAKLSPHQGVTRFIWDEDLLLQEWDDHDQRTFVYEPDSFVPLAQVVKGRGKEEHPAQIYYYHCDQVGLPREVTDTAGQFAWEADYRGWGGTSHENQAALPQALRYQGQYFDAETGLHYNLLRYYDPDCGRFVSKDPIGLLGGLNEYQYAPNPVGWIDPWGLTGTYIMSGGKKRNYVGKGPKVRSQASKRARLAGCKKKVLVHKDYKDDEMGFMVEHLLMKHYKARTSTSWANSPNLNSPGKKKYEAASAKRKAEARRKAKALREKFEAEKAACGL